MRLRNYLLFFALALAVASGGCAGVEIRGKGQLETGVGVGSR